LADITRKLLISLSFVAFCLLGVEFLGVHFSLYSASRGDFIYSSSATTWIYLSLLIVVVLFCYRRVGSSALNLAAIFLPFVFVVVFQLSQYPSLAHADYFNNGALVEVLTSDATIQSFLGYFQYPGSFILLTMIGNTLDISALESEILLVSVLTLAVPVVLLLVGRWLKGGSEWLVPVVFFAVGQDYVVRRHFTPEFPGFFLFVLAVYMLTKMRKARSWSWALALILTGVAATVIHPFSSLFLLLTVFMSFLFERADIIHGQKTREVFMFFLVVFAVWNAYVASPYFQQGVKLASSFITLERFSSSTALRTTPSGLLGIVLPLYRYGVHIFFLSVAFVGLIKFRHQEEVRQLFAWAVAIVMGSLAILLVAPEIAVERGIIFLYIPISVLASLFFIKSFPTVFSRLSTAGSRARITRTHAIVAILLVIEVTTFVVGSSFASTNGEFVHPSQMQAARFAVRYLQDQPNTYDRELFVWAYYKVENLADNLTNAPSSQSNAQERLLSQQFSLQNSLEQEYLLGLGFVGADRSLIYNDGLNRIYMRA
jgi:hypothetical protein